MFPANPYQPKKKLSKQPMKISLPLRVKIISLMGQIVIILIVFGLALLVLRLFGAWMLRIDELIDEQKKTNTLLVQGFNKVNENIKHVIKNEETETETNN
jgi:hypothetical protein